MSASTLATDTRSATRAMPRSARRLGQLGFAVLLFALFADLSVLQTQYVHGGAYATRGFYESDWLMFYHAAERLRDGGNAYAIAGEFRNPPPFLLLARAALVLPYIPSRIIWSLASTAMLLAAGALTAAAMPWQPDGKTRLIGALYILLYTPTVLLIPLAGNSTAPVVLCYALALWLFTRGSEGGAGASLCLALMIKPQLAFLTFPLLLYKRRWRASVAYLVSAAAITGLSLLVAGPQTFVDFYHMERSTASGANSIAIWIRDNPGMHTALLQIWPESALAGALAYLFGLALVGALAWYWRGPWQPRSTRFYIGWAMVPIVDLLVAPYAHSDDLVLLIVPGVVLYALWRRRYLAQATIGRWIPPTLIALYIAPILVVFLRQHFMVPAMLAALWVLWQAATAEAGSVNGVTSDRDR